MYFVRRRGVSNAWLYIHWRVCWCGHCIVLVSTVSFATPLVLIKHTTGQPTCHLTSASHLGWKVHKMSQTGFHSNFSAALLKVALKIWSSIFRPYVCFLPAYIAYVRVCLLFHISYYVFHFFLIFLNPFCFLKTWNSRQWAWSCSLLECDVVLSGINLLTFQSNLQPDIVRSLSHPEDDCNSFPKGR
jgi:hypothetical protein